MRTRHRCVIGSGNCRTARRISSPACTRSGASTDTTRVPRGEIFAALRGSRWKAKTTSIGAAISVLTVIWLMRY